MLDASSVPAARKDFHDEPSSALGTKARRFESAGVATALVVDVRHGYAAAVAEDTRLHGHSAADNALIGMDNSSSNAKSSDGSRPSVVR